MPYITDLDWSVWLSSIVSAFIGGGASAISAGFVVSLRDPKDYAFGSWSSFQLMLSVFGVSGFISVCMYLKQSPWPTVKTTTTVKVTEQKPNPPVVETTKTVVTNVQEGKG